MHSNSHRLPSRQKRPHLSLLVTTSRKNCCSIIFPSRTQNLQQQPKTCESNAISLTENILHKIVEIQMHYGLIMWNWSLGCTGNNSSILWYLPTPNLLKEFINQYLVCFRMFSYSLIDVATYAQNNDTWLSQEVATRKLALGLKERLEMESVGGCETWKLKVVNDCWR